MPVDILSWMPVHESINTLPVPIVLQCVAGCCKVLPQCVAVCCSNVLQFAAAINRLPVPVAPKRPAELVASKRLLELVSTQKARAGAILHQ